jgi:oligoribonuclease NrnB/cAMP/cGMP phosphodiesterase (DHH superfamily)
VRRVCFYHAGCPDGFGAAWAVWKAWGEEGEYRPRGHDDPLAPGTVRGADVVFVDIAPSNEALKLLAEETVRLTVLDHHRSALERLRGNPSLENLLSARGHVVHFDLDHSGATLAWACFHPQAPTPALLEYVEDMDLWRWKLERSEEVNAAVSSYPRRFEVWDELADSSIERLAEEGVPILRAQRMEVERAVTTAHPIALGTRRVEGVNAVAHRAAIGHQLAKRAAYGLPCGVVYRLAGRRVDVSLYSIGDFDAAAIANDYGGGGHRNAAGFYVTLVDWLEHFV